MNDNDDLKYKLLNKIGLTPQSIATTTVNATGVDMGNSGAYVLASVIVGTVSSGGTATVKLQSSRNDNTADAGAAADAYADISGATVSLPLTLDRWFNSRPTLVLRSTFEWLRRPAERSCLGQSCKLTQRLLGLSRPRLQANHFHEPG